jgi:hypothetical protein
LPKGRLPTRGCGYPGILHTGIDPQAWLADVLARINDHAIHRVEELLPWNWRKPVSSHAEAA